MKQRLQPNDVSGHGSETADAGGEPSEQSKYLPSISKHKFRGVPCQLNRHKSLPIYVGYSDGSVQSASSRNCDTKVPYRRRRSSTNARAEGNEPSPQARSAEEFIEEIQRLPAVERNHSAMFYELPAIMITSVRYVSQESDDIADRRHAALLSQDQFTYLSSGEDDADDDEFVSLGRELSEVLHQPNTTTRLYSSDQTKLYPSGKSEQEKRFPVDKSKKPIPSCLSFFSSETTVETQETSDSIVTDSSATDAMAQPLVYFERKFAYTSKGSSFVERLDNVKRQQFAEDYWYEYSQDVDIAALDSRAQAAFAAAVARCERRSEEEGCSSIYTSLRLDRFLANYFMDPDVFDVDADLCVDMLKANYRSSCFSPEQVAGALQGVPMICKACLMNAVHVTLESELPHDPARYLSTALQCTPVCGSSAVKRHVEDFPAAAENGIPRCWYDQVRSVLLTHASTPAQDTCHLESLLKAGGLPFCEDEDSLICLAASYNYFKAIVVLFAFGSNLNETQEQGLSKQTPLEICSTFGYESVVSFLLDNGAFFGRSLHYAAKAGHTSIVRLLLDAGAHPLVRIDGYSPLSLAVLGSHFQVVEHLVCAGASVDTVLEISVCHRLGLEPGQTIREYALLEGLGPQLSAALAKTTKSPTS